MALNFPPIYLLKTRFDKDLDKLVNLSNEIGVVHCIDEAKIVLTKGSSPRRAQLDLSTLGVRVTPITQHHNVVENEKQIGGTGSPQKRRKIENKSSNGNYPGFQSHQEPDREDTIKVLKLEWYEDSVKAGVLLPVEKYFILEGIRSSQPAPKATKSEMSRSPQPADILAQAYAGGGPSQFPVRKSGGPRPSSVTHLMTKPTLVRESTSEHDKSAGLPPLPPYLHTNYACQRPTPLYSPNDSFIDELKKIRTARMLNGDEIGVRAYSSSIATLAAYPHTLTSPQEILALPKCDQKIALLFQQWKETNHIPEVDEIEADARLQVLKVFFEIWGVGSTTAREFYDKGWRDLDDIVIYGWDRLTRVQQIGLKYYDEFAQKIPREEVEQIGKIIFDHANKIRKGYQMVIVGGYRKGKSECGDVDVVLSHPEDDATDMFIAEIESSLVSSGWITHTLTLSIRNSQRGQMPVSWKGDVTKPRTGFDTLDKALVVWQDPKWLTQAEDLRRDPNAKNPNIHRRVDIIVSPWKTAGTAVLGWSGGTTFERDLRQYCKKERNLKFDSSGIRSRLTGAWVDVEAGPGDMLDKERRVFQALGLEWRDPTERCTG